MRLIHLLILTLAILQPSSALAKRVAIVIGNDTYQTLPQLNNAARDARDMASMLSRLGFEVIVRTDAGSQEIGRALAEFEAKASGAEAALVFYAGHGIQADGVNWLIPSDANVEVEADLRFEGIRASELLETMKRAGADVNILILDACRDNPLPKRVRSGARGLEGLANSQGRRRNSYPVFCRTRRSRTGRCAWRKWDLHGCSIEGDGRTWAGSTESVSRDRSPGSDSHKSRTDTIHKYLDLRRGFFPVSGARTDSFGS